VICLSGVTSVPSTSEMTSEIAVTAQPCAESAVASPSHPIIARIERKPKSAIALRDRIVD
jgi:hypothetical protein